MPEKHVVMQNLHRAYCPQNHWQHEEISSQCHHHLGAHSQPQIALLTSRQLDQFVNSRQLDRPTHTIGELINATNRKYSQLRGKV